MREHESKSRYDLEVEIQRITGVSVGPHPKWDDIKIDAKYYYEIDGLVAEWLRKCGVTEANLTRIGIQSGGRANCFTAGVEWVTKVHVRGEESDHKARRNTRGFGRPDTSGFSFNTGPKKELGDLLGLPKSGEEYGSDLSDEEKITITHNMLKNATNAILEPQINAMRVQVVEGATKAINEKLSELDSEIREKVKVEISVERSEAVKIAVKQATDIAIDTALKACDDFINKRIPRRIEVKLGAKEPKLLTDEPRHKAFDEILFWAAQGIHVYMWGPKGTGKTHLLPQVCDALDRKYTPIGQSLSKYDVTGYMSATGDYIKTHAREAMEFGHCLGVDEGDTWAAAALIALNTPLANRYCPFPDKIIQVHDNFLCLLAANTTGFGATPEFQGRNPLDSTSTDRFAFVHVDYDEDLEIALYGNTPWVRYVHEVRNYVRTQMKQTAALPSMRPIQMGTKALAAGGDPDMVCRGILWKAMPQDMINKIETHCGKFGRREAQEEAA